MNSKSKKLDAFARLLDIMDLLRNECPWDKKQTIESLRHLTIEETYELSESILKGDRNDIKHELGDILLHVVFYSKIASEENAFDIKDVIEKICEKLIYRHPHIFGKIKVANEFDVKKNWEVLKLKEGSECGTPLNKLFLPPLSFSTSQFFFTSCSSATLILPNICG